jgi:hypothetical protein
MRKTITVNNLLTRTIIDSTITRDGATARAMAVYYRAKYPAINGNYVTIN